MIKPGSHFRNDVESTSLALIQRIVSSGVARAIKHINPYNAEIYLYKPWRSKCYFQFKIIRNGLVSSFRFNSLSAGERLLRQILTYKDGICAERVQN